jgi:hypothetical protein
LLHLWSLCIEEQFYIVWPLLVFLTWRFRKRFWLVLLPAFALSFCLNIFYTSTDRPAAFFLTQNRFWELLIGSTLAYARIVAPSHGKESPLILGESFMPGRRGRLFADIASGTGLAMLLGAFAGFSHTLAFPGFWALIPTFGAFLMIGAGPDAWVNRNILRQRLLVSVGLISYPLYLWHYSLLSFSSIVQLGRPTVASKVLALTASFVLAWCSNRFIERQIRFGGHKRISPWVIPAALTATLAVIALVGVQITAQAGNAGRLSRETPVASVKSHGVPAVLPQKPASPVVQPDALPAEAPRGNAISQAPEPISAAGEATPATPTAEKDVAPKTAGRQVLPFFQDIANYSLDHALDGWRSTACFLDVGQTAAAFAPDCVDQEPQSKPLILLWGDSNAASLASGLRSLQGRFAFRFGQLTASACPPVLGYATSDRPNCKGINDAIYKELETLKPATILLASQGYGSDPAALEMLKSSLEMVRSGDPKRLILVGPSPPVFRESARFCRTAVSGRSRCRNPQSHQDANGRCRSGARQGIQTVRGRKSC